MSPRMKIFGPLAVVVAVVLGLGVVFAAFQREAAQREATPTASPAAAPTTTGGTVAPTKGNAAAGQAVFQTSCNACHPGGGQGVGPALQGPAFASKYPTDDAISKVVRQGMGVMPAFSPDRLSDQQLADVIAYVRSLSSGTEAGPTKAPSPTAAPPSPTVTAVTPTTAPTAVPTQASSEPTATKAPPTPTTAAPTPTTAPTQPTISGKAVFEAKCSTCHALPNPGDYSKWQAQFEPMAAMAGLSAAEKQAVLNYLQGR
ncbi:MAG: cytochrome c [Chloroflexi bacterium]|nr:cytochrome c [Chloroflexota bacterium]